jgi:hypothetical protein
MITAQNTREISKNSLKYAIDACTHEIVEAAKFGKTSCVVDLCKYPESVRNDVKSILSEPPNNFRVGSLRYPNDVTISWREDE